MCDPLSIAGAVMSVGSAVANQSAANQQAKAQASAMSAERTRQRMLDDEARGTNTRAQDRYEDIEGQQQAQASQLEEVFAGDANRGAEVISAALPRSSSNITNQNDERERGEATGFANQQGEALARMRSFSDMFGGIDRGVAQDGSEIGMLGGFKRGSQGVLPFELEAASHAGGNRRMLGDLLGMGGGLAMNAGLSGASLFGPRAATNVNPISRSPFPQPRPMGRLY